MVQLVQVVAFANKDQGFSKKNKDEKLKKQTNEQGLQSSKTSTNHPISKSKIP